MDQPASFAALEIPKRDLHHGPASLNKNSIKEMESKNAELNSTKP